MNIGKAVAIFTNIDREDISLEEKGTAIYEVLKMPTHDGIRKDRMLKVIDWLLRLSFDLPNDDPFAENIIAFPRKVGDRHAIVKKVTKD